MAKQKRKRAKKIKRRRSKRWDWLMATIGTVATAVLVILAVGCVCGAYVPGAAFFGSAGLAVAAFAMLNGYPPLPLVSLGTRGIDSP